MKIYPAIDIKEGKCVRLFQGKKEDVKVYFENPVEVAQMWVDQGAEILHIVDLDGAFDGESETLSIIREIASMVDIPVQVGGGIRSRDKADLLVDMGCDIILGTAAVTNRPLLEELVAAYGDKVIVSVDCKDGMVTTEGWVKTANVTAKELITDLIEIGVKKVVVTDIARDGALIGPNLEFLEKLNSLDVTVVASGGISSAKDIKDLEAIGIQDAIVGKALYEGLVDLREFGGKGSC